MSEKILAAALSAVTNRTIVTYDQFCGRIPDDDYRYDKLDQVDLHRYNLVGGRVEMALATGVEQNNWIYVTFFTNKTLKMEYKPNETIYMLKYKIQRDEMIPITDQVLRFLGIRLVDNCSLSECNIKAGDTLELFEAQRGGGGPPLFYIHPDLRDEEFDFDFTDVKDDGVKYIRGKHTYKRPYGWDRLALKVADKYQDTVWLGSPGHRLSSDKNEWPVSYHGTAKYNCNSIAEDGYQLSKSERFLFGYGIYSTPDINVAALYAATFKHDGDDYKVVFQNRVNPNTLAKIAKKKTGVGEYWISPKKSDTRPYGICIMKFTT